MRRREYRKTLAKKKTKMQIDRNDKQEEIPIDHSVNPLKITAFSLI